MNAEKPRSRERREEKVYFSWLFLGVLASWRSILLLALITASASAQDTAKPKIAVFPLAGNSAADVRDRIGFSIRAKLDRDGAYEPLDGPMMQDIAAQSATPITFDSSPDAVKDLARGSDAVVLVWGDDSTAAGKDHLRLKTLDLRAKDAAAVSFESDISDPQQIRSVVERFLQTLPGVTPFTHPNEQAVHHDPASDALFAANPNLLVNGDFSQSGHWQAIFKTDQYFVGAGDELPATDRAVIYHLPADDGEKAHNVLVMDLSFHTAQNNGLACLSDAIEIAPGVRYRLSYRYRSDGPSLQTIVKGYAPDENLPGQPADREVYRMQVPPGGATGGKWKLVEADLNPRNPDFPVQRLRVDLYAYLNKGLIMFDNVQLKAVGEMNAQAASRPADGAGQ